MSKRTARQQVTSAQHEACIEVSDRVYSCDDFGQVAFVEQHGLWSLPLWPGEVPESAHLLCEHTTPSGFEVRRKTRVFIGQRVPKEAIAADPKRILRRWHLGKLRIDPGTLAALNPSRIDGEESVAGIRSIPVLSQTLPPSTHTNCYVLGYNNGLVIDPGTHVPEEVDRLACALERHVGRYGPLQAIVLTHHHHDHVAAAAVLATRFRLPIWAHRSTAQRVSVGIDRTLNSGDVINDHWEVLHTPGHAPGHIVLMRRTDGAAILGDMVASIGTILIHPDEGHMGQYIESLRQIRELSPTSLHPAHGGPIWQSEKRLAQYIQHRLWRESVVAGFLTSEPRTVQMIAKRAYVQTPEKLMWLAELSTLSHLRWLAEQGRAQHVGGSWCIV